MTPGERRLLHDIESLTREMARLKAAVHNHRRASGLARSAVDDGALTVTRAGEATMALGVQYDGTSAPAVLIGPVPPTATQPVVVGAVGGAVVAWDGLFLDDTGAANPTVVAPMDFSHVEIHASPDAAYDAATADTIVGTFDTARGGSRFIPLPGSSTRYVRFVVRALSGKRAAASATAAVAPTFTEADIGPTARPQTSPRVAAASLSKSLLVRALDPVDQFTSLLYEVSRNAAFTDIVTSISTRQTAITLAPLPEQTDLYVRVTASNIIGDAVDGPSPAVGPVRTLVLGSSDIPDLFDVIGDVNEINNALPTLVQGYVTEYAVGASETVAPNTGWATTSPARTAGSFIWTRVTVTRADGSTSTTNPAVLTGNTGAPGANGSNAPLVFLTATAQALISPAAGGATNPATSVITGAAVNTTISAWTYSVDGAAFMATAPPGVARSGNAVTITGASMAARTIAVRMADTNGVADTLTVARVLDGAAGAAGAAGRGITGTAVTYQVGASGTTEPTGTWSSTLVATTAPGQYLWARTVTTYSDASTSTAYAVSAHGATGAAGTNGVGITGTTVTYQVATSGTTAPTGTWSATPVATTAPGQYLWSRTVTSYSDASATTTYAVSAHGATGTPGTNGVGITGTTVTYQVGTSGTAAPTGAWSGTPVATTAPGQFLWTRTVTAYSDASTTTAYAISAHGATGSSGNAGRGISSTAVTYQIGTDGTTAPGGTWAGAPVATSPGQFLWTRTVTTYTDATTATGYSVSAHGSTGSAGADAYTVVLTNEAQVYAGSTTAAVDGSATAQVLAFKGPDQQAATIGTIATQPTGLTVTVQNNGTTTAGITVTVTPALTQQSGTITLPITVSGQSFTKTFSWSVTRAGTAGSAGTNGRGVQSIAVAYQIGADGVTPPTGTWVAAPPATSPGQYLWTRTITTLTDASATTGYSVALQGATGGPGTSGVGISTSAITYQAHTNGTTAPTGTWLASPPVVSPGQFLWTRTVLTLTNASTQTSYSVALQGATGTNGTNGVSVNSITPYFARLATGAAVPAQPTTDPPPAPWVLTEPSYTTGTVLYRTERIIFSNATVAYTSVTRSAVYDGIDAVQANVNRKVQWVDANPVNGTTVGATGDVVYVRGAGGTVASIWEATGANTWAQKYIAESAVGTLSVAKITGLQTTLNGLSGDLSKVHIIDPIPILTSNTTTFTISWPAFTVKYGGLTTTVAASSTLNRYVIFRWNNGVPSIEQTDTRPVLGAGDNLLFSNLRGVGVRMFATVQIDADLLVDGSITTRALASEAVTTKNLAADAITVDMLLSKSIFTTALTSEGVHIGTGSWTAGKGIDIPDVMSIPVDGSVGASITAALTAQSITIENFFTLQGTVNSIATGATLVLDNGITKPTSPATVTSYYPQTLLGYSNWGDFTVGPDYGDFYVLSGNGGTYINRFDRYGTFLGGQNISLAPNYMYNAWSITTALGPSMVRYLYICGQDGDGTPAIYRTNMSMTSLTRVAGLSSNIDANGTIKHIACRNNSNGLIDIISRDTDGNMYKRSFNPVTNAVAARELMSGLSKTVQYKTGFTRYVTGNYDDELVLFPASANPQVFNNSSGASAFGTRLTTKEFVRADGAPVSGADGDVRAIAGSPNGAMFATLDGTNGTIRYYTTTTWNHQLCYTWYDSVSPVQETDPSTIQAMSVLKYAFARVVIPAVPANGTDDGPDPARTFGAVTGQAQRLQATIAAGSTTAVFASFSASSSVAPPLPGNLGFGAASSPGALESVATSGGSRTISLRGDGSWRMGHLAGTANGTDANERSATIAPTAPFINYGNDVVNVPTVTRFGKIIIFEGVLGPGTAANGTAIQSTTAPKIGTIPLGFRPARNINTVFRCTGSGNDTWALRVSPNGDFWAERFGPGNAGAATWLPFAVSFRTADALP